MYLYIISRTQDQCICNFFLVVSQTSELVYLRANQRNECNNNTKCYAFLFLPLRAHKQTRVIQTSI